MKQKLLTLLTALLFMSSGAWATETETFIPTSYTGTGNKTATLADATITINAYIQSKTYNNVGSTKVAYISGGNYLRFSASSACITSIVLTGNTDDNSKSEALTYQTSSDGSTWSSATAVSGTFSKRTTTPTTCTVNFGSAVQYVRFVKSSSAYISIGHVSVTYSLNPPIAAQTFTNGDKTCTWGSFDANLNVSTYAEKANNGLYLVGGTSNAITNEATGKIVLKTGNTLYVQVPSPRSAGTITFSAAANADNYLELNSGSTIKQDKTSNNSANFVGSDVENVNGGYYIKLVNKSGTSQFKFTGIVVTLTGETVKTNAGGWASYTPMPAYKGTTYNATIAAGANPYIITAVESGATSVTGNTVTTMEAGKGYFIKGATSKSYATTYTSESADATEGNLLVGRTTAIDITADSPVAKAKYVLGTATSGSNSGKSGLFLVDGTVNVGAGKAYLQSDLEQSNGANFLTLDFEGNETTGINSLNTSHTNNYADVIYNLAGQRVAQPTKGMYIVNGKKIIIK